MALEPHPRGVEFLVASHALIGLFVLLEVAFSGLVTLAHSFDKPFYLPAEGMHPTLMVDDRFVDRHATS